MANKPLKKNVFDGSGQRLWKKAKTLIPGGNQLLSKRAEMFLPDHWPAYYSKAKGVHVWDLDGNKYLDMSIHAVGACGLGYADPDVDRAVIAAIKRGTNTTLNVPEEVELAELLCKIHPWAHMVRYARAGGESMAIAARIARAYTGRDIVAFCGYHGWSDWYLATNLRDPKGLNDHLLAGLEPRGVPQSLQGSIVPFHYNKIEELEKIMHEHHGKVAAIIMEPVKSEEPKDGFLKKVRELATKHGTVLIFDEVSIGWKIAYGGAHLHYGVDPDIAVFGKTTSNGYPMGAIIGTRDVMQAAQTTFISSSYWTEAIGPVAALATLKKMKRVNFHKKLASVGAKVRALWFKYADKHGIEIATKDILPIQPLIFKGDDSAEVKTYYVQEMLRRGILASGAFYASLAHTDAHLRQYEKALDQVFGLIAQARKAGGVKSRLIGPVAHSHFQRLN